MRTLITFSRFILAVLPILSAACDVPPTDTVPDEEVEAPAEAADTRPAPDGIGVVELALATIPDGVQCLRVSAKGPYREKVSLLPVTAGAAFKQTLSGLPLGRVVFFGEAFDGACDAVTARTIPAFASDEVAVSIVEGGKGNVELHMQKHYRMVRRHLLGWGVHPGAARFDALWPASHPPRKLAPVLASAAACRTSPYPLRKRCFASARATSVMCPTCAAWIPC